MIKEIEMGTYMTAIFSFFSGVGMLDLGFEENGYNIVRVNEYEEAFLKAYKYARRNQNNVEPRFGYDSCDFSNLFKKNALCELKEQIRMLKEEGEIVGFIGGPPCPDFSVGGKNRGAEGKNGILTDQYFKLIGRCMPDFFVFENVKGLVKTEKHRVFFEKQKKYIRKKGYIIESEILNSLSFGVPQDRERIFMIGFKKNSKEKGLRITKELAEQFFRTLNIRPDVNYIKNYKWPETNPFIVDEQRNCIKGTPTELTVQYWFEKNNVENHPNSNDIFVVREGKSKMETIQEGDVRRKSFKRLHRWRYSPTAAYGNNEVHLHPYKIRRISASEAMAIQSMPEWFELPKEMQLTKKFKTIGNGVPYLMGFEIARNLNEFINNIERTD
jgi:DNA (cytosine-5)-methyltransferase 1